MQESGEIKSGKILVKDIFERMWFRVPRYQRPYVWTRDEVAELLNDLTFAQANKPNDEYFLGSFVFQSNRVDHSKGEEFDENDLLDGQQRMTTLLMLFAVIRDRLDDTNAKETCQKYLYQKANKFTKIPERPRLVFPIRPAVEQFIDKYVKTKDGTKERYLGTIAEGDKDISRMAEAILEMNKSFSEKGTADIENLFEFLLNKVILIYVSTDRFEDAFRLFTILNNRGIPLRNSDILKSRNLGVLDTEENEGRYAKMWEEAENELGGDEFERFLNHVRTILVKKKARKSLLSEFEDEIYEPRLLEKGKATFQLIERYLGCYRTVCHDHNDDQFGNFKFHNLVNVMVKGLPATDWIPPLLRYFDRFQFDRLLEFLKKLDNKFSADWISKYTPTECIERMNKVIQVIDKASTPEKVLGAACFHIDGRSFMTNVSDCVYGKRHVRYLLLKLDYLHQDHSDRISVGNLSVEHILPQSPLPDSQWIRDFSETERDKWTDRLGNLVLISTRKNSSQGRWDYTQKKEKYFKRLISTRPNSLRVLQNNDRWTLVELKANHDYVLKRLREYYAIEDEPCNT